ncbi:MAG: hypothetical protein Q9212_005927 [Teloschistes hypoglaucus]
MSGEAAPQQNEGPGPSKIEWRSRTDHKPVDLRQKFKKNDVVYYNGARGSTGPFYVDQVLGNGTYKLRQEDGKVLKPIYNEGKLSNKPRAVG